MLPTAPSPARLEAAAVVVVDSARVCAGNDSGTHRRCERRGIDIGIGIGTDTGISIGIIFIIV